ncbi:MAG: hypothetical protein H2069_02175 [Legionella sp.]|nr:hypothetical protein [Legionella sp.]
MIKLKPIPMKKKTEPFVSFNPLSLPEKEQLLIKYFDSKGAPYATPYLFEALKLPYFSKPKKKQKDNIVLAIENRLQKANINQISIPSFLRFELPFLWQEVGKKQKFKHVQAFFYSYIQECSPEIKGLLLEKYRSPKDRFNEILDIMQIPQRADISDPAQKSVVLKELAEEILCRIASKGGKQPLSFAHFLQDNLYTLKRAAGLHLNPKQVEGLQKKAKEIAFRVKIFCRGTAADDLLFNNFTDNLERVKREVHVGIQSDQEVIRKKVKPLPDAHPVLENVRDSSKPLMQQKFYDSYPITPFLNHNLFKAVPRDHVNPAEPVEKMGELILSKELHMYKGSVFNNHLEKEFEALFSRKVP